MVFKNNSRLKKMSQMSSLGPKIRASTPYLQPKIWVKLLGFRKELAVFGDFCLFYEDLFLRKTFYPDFMLAIAFHCIFLYQLFQTFAQLLFCGHFSTSIPSLEPRNGVPQSPPTPLDVNGTLSANEL